MNTWYKLLSDLNKADLNLYLYFEDRGFQFVNRTDGFSSIGINSVTMIKRYKTYTPRVRERNLIAWIELSRNTIIHVLIEKYHANYYPEGIRYTLAEGKFIKTETWYLDGYLINENVNAWIDENNITRPFNKATKALYRLCFA